MRATLLTVTLVLWIVTAGAATAQQPARSTTLPNGLDLVMQPDGSSPLLSSLLIVHAGSGNETLATQGATHLLEHMIFRGTATRSQDEIYDSLDRMGAYYNAQTSKTYTNFILVVPVEQAQGAMAIQADMILNSVIDPDTLKIEKGRVLNEIRQGLERSSTRAENHHVRNVYAPTSYGFPTVGTVENIEAIPAENVRAFHDDWYAVNNMTLVLRGDLSFAEMEALADEVYGSLVPRDLPDRPDAWPAGLDDWRRNQVHVEYGASGNGSLRMTIAAPRHDAPDAPAHATLALLLGDRLEAKLQSGMPLVTYVYSGLERDPEFSVLSITAGLMPGSDPQVVADSMLAAVRSLDPGSFSMDEIEAALREDQRGELFFAEQVQYGSFLLVPKLAVAPWGFWDRFSDAQSHLTPQDLSEAFAYWFEQPSWLATAYLPEPEGGSADAVTLGPIEREVLDNGLTVVAREVQGAPVAGIHLAVKGRSAWERDGKQGWVDLLHRLLDTGDGLDERLTEVGMEMQVGDDPRVPMDDYRTTPEYSYVRVQAVAQNWAEAMGVLAGQLAVNDYDEAAVEQARSELAARHARARESVGSKTNARFEELLYGDHIQAASLYGDSTTLATADREALLAFRDKVFAADKLVLSVLAPAPAAQIIDVTGQLFGDLPSGAAPVPAVGTPEMTATVDTVTAPGQQGYLATGFLLSNVPAFDHAALLVANAILSDRIYRDLGEKKGWAYGAGSSLLLRPDYASWSSRAALPVEHLEEAREVIAEHRDTLAKGKIDSGRVEIARNDLRGSLLRRYSSRINLAMALGADEVIWDDPGRTWELFKAIEAVTLDDVITAARSYLRNPSGTVTVYGLPEASDDSGPRMPPGMGGMGGMGGH